MSNVFDVSASGYYHWVNRKESRRYRRKRSLQQEITVIYQEHNGYAGSPLIAEDLKSKEEFKDISRTRVAKEMKELKLRCKTRKKYTHTTDSSHKEPVAENLLNREFTQERPNCAWVTDITYLQVKSKWVYLVVFIDLFNREVVGWDVSESLKTESSIYAFNKAVNKKNPPSGLMVHSDRGVQYASQDFRCVLREHNCIQSMSRKGNCWDNAVAESFFSTLKKRLTRDRNYNSIEELKRDLFWYIEIYYNRYRKHSANNWISPADKLLYYFEELRNCA